MNNFIQLSVVFRNVQTLLSAAATDFTSGRQNIHSFNLFNDVRQEHA